MKKDEIESSAIVKNLKKEIATLKESLSKATLGNEKGIYENEYHSLYHNVPMGVMHYDDNGIILDCNNLFVKLVGSSREALIGLDMIKNLPDKKLVSSVKESLLKGEGRYEGLYRSTTAVKETPIIGLFKGLRSEDGDIYGGICIVEDLTEKVKAEKALKRTEENYKLILKNTTDVYYRTTKQGILLSLNPSVKDLLLLDNIEDAIGRNVIDFYYTPSDRVSLMKELQNNGSVQGYVVDLKRGDGKKVTVELNSQIVYDDDGEIHSIVGVFHDVTTRFEAEFEKSTNLWFLEKLEKVDDIIRKAIDDNEIFEGLLSTIIESFKCDIALIFSSENNVDSTWHLKTAAKSDNVNYALDPYELLTSSFESNELFYRISMYEGLVIIDDNNNEEIDDLFKKMKVKAQLMKAITLNSGESLIFCVNHCSSNRIWNKYEEALFNEVTSRLTDAINSYESSELLHKSEEHHRSLIEATSEGYFEIDEEGTIVVANNAMCDMLGYLLNEFITEPYSKFISPNSQVILAEQILNTKEKHPGSFEIELQHKDGNKVYTLCNITVRSAEGGKNNGAFFFVTDISNLKKVELEKEGFQKELEKKNLELEELNQSLITALNKAEESDELKTLFIKNISHEVRTPLNGIIGFIEMITQGDLSIEEQKEYTNYIISSSNQLTTIISDILEFSKLEAGQIKIDNKEFCLNNLLDELHSHFRTLLISKNKAHIDFKIDKPLPDDQSSVIADKSKIRQVLSNFLSNAIKFTLEGEITLGYKILGDKSINFFVADTGVGIPDSDNEIIFDKFRQGATTDSAIYGGNGLGLTISQSLSDLLGAKIWFESIIGSGTQFYITVPTIKSANEKIINYNSSKERIIYNWEDKKVLIVDDVLEVYKLISVYLRSTKAKHLYAINGNQAVELCQQNPDIDIVLLDIQLPDIDGYRIVKALKEINNNIPIIAQTAFALSDDKEKALAAGFDDYITKPIYKKPLLELMDKYLK